MDVITFPEIIIHVIKARPIAQLGPWTATPSLIRGKVIPERQPANPDTFLITPPVHSIQSFLRVILRFPERTRCWLIGVINIQYIRTTSRINQGSEQPV